MYKGSDKLSGEPVQFVGADIPLPPPQTMEQQRTALDTLLATMHKQYKSMNDLCIQIMESNLQLMQEIIQLRKQLTEGGAKNASSMGNKP